MGVIARARRAVCGWGSLDCCSFACVCVCVIVCECRCGCGCGCGCDCVGEDGSVWVEQP